MRHPVECFDSEILSTMAASLEAAIQTLRLAGREPGPRRQLAMARRIILGASLGAGTRLSLTEAALDGAWD
jgi:hypothetical protein